MVELLAAVSNVLVEFTSQTFATVGWSERFLPTSGRSTKEVIFKALSVSRSPIPESSRRWGEPMEPADRITSLVAVNSRRGPSGSQYIMLEPH